MAEVVVRGQTVLRLSRPSVSPVGEIDARDVFVKVEASVTSLTEPQILKKGIQVWTDFELALGEVSSFVAVQFISPVFIWCQDLRMSVQKVANQLKDIPTILDHLGDAQSIVKRIMPFVVALSKVHLVSFTTLALLSITNRNRLIQ